MLRVHGVVRVRWVVVVMVEEFGRGERLAGVVRAGGINRDGRALGGVELGAHLVVQPAEHRAVPHPEVIALGQWDRASGAREATHVEHQVSGPHHQLRGEDRRVAASASLHAAEHPAKKKEHGSERKENPRRRGDPFEPRPIEWQLQLTTIVKIEMAMIGEFSRQNDSVRSFERISSQGEEGPIKKESGDIRAKTDTLEIEDEP